MVAGAAALIALAVLMGWPGGAHAADPRRIGLLDTSAATEARVALWTAMRQRLAELGYREGPDVRYEARFGDGKADELARHATELVRLKVAVLVTSGTPATQAAMQATRTIPIVMTNQADPVGAGLVASLARPGGNVTGMSSQDADLGGKRLELLRQVVPRVTRIAQLVDESNPGTRLIAKSTKTAAESLGLVLQHVGVSDGGELDRAFASIKEGRAGALVVESSSMLFTWRVRLAEQALHHRVPTMFAQRQYTEAGGLMSYSAEFADLFRRSATFVDKVLKGARPGDLPVEQPTKYDFALNLKTAKTLGLTIPQALRVRADFLIE